MTATPSEKIDPHHVEAAVAIALKLARFRPTRGLTPTDSDEVCGAAARAVMAHFERAGWQVIKVGEYLGYGVADSLPSFTPEPRQRRCQDCD